MRTGKASHQPPNVPLPDDGAQLSYGLAGDGRLVHVSAVANGLACCVRCAGCRGPLIAKHGPKNVHHFAHCGDGACPGAGETTLHLLAKQVILEARAIMLPEAVATAGGYREQVAAAQLFRYESARKEVTLDGLVPDIILKSGERELHVEIYVAHASGPHKLAKLRQRNLPSFEIDLSRVSRLASPEEHAEWVLTSAPRRWLHNRKLAEAEAGLRVRAERRSAAELQKRKNYQARIGNEIAEVWNDEQVGGAASWSQWASDAGYRGFVGVPIGGDRCFRVSAATWQAAFLKHVIIDLAGHRVGTDGTLRRLQKFGMLKEPMKLRRDWNAELVACVRERLPEFRSPCEALDEYASFLADQGVLTKMADGGWYVPAESGEAARQTVENAEQTRARGERLEEMLSPFVLALGDDGDRLVAAWITRSLPGTRVTPLDLLRDGGPEWAELFRGLDSLKPMLRPDGPVLGTDCFLGLPLDEIRLTRKAEAQAWRKELDELEKERRRRDAEEFVNSLSLEAEKRLGLERGRAWVLQLLGDLTTEEREDGRFNRNSSIRQDMEAALVQECVRVAAAHHVALRRKVELEAAAAAAESSRAELEQCALRWFLGDADRTRLWLRGVQPSLAVSPLEFCVNKKTLSDCKKLLEAPAKRRK